MSSNAILKDKIIGILENIINNSKHDTLLLSELSDLLKQLKEITVFNGIQMFIDAIETRQHFEIEIIKKYLLKNIMLISYYQILLDYVKPPLSVSNNEQNDDLLDKKPLEEESDKNFFSDLKKLDEKLVDLNITKDELTVGGGHGTKTEHGFSARGGGGKGKDSSLDDLSSVEKRARIQEKPEVVKSDSIPPPQPATAPTSVTSTPSVASKEMKMPESASQKPSPKPSPLPDNFPSPQPSRKNEQPIITTREDGKKKQKKEDKKPKEKKQSAKFEETADLEMIVEDEHDESMLVESGKRSILIDYFSRMNINQVYDFTIKIDKELLKAKKKQSDLLTGEQREQLTDEITVVEDIPIEVELSVPGCLVSPQFHYVSPDTHSSQVTFFVTPYVKFSKKMALLIIGQKKLDKKVIPLEVNVIDRRIMKIFSVVGLLIAGLPSVWPYMFGQDMNENIVNSAQTYLPYLTSTMLLPIEIGLGGLVTVTSLLFFKKYSSKRNSFVSKQAI
jgi:hypothetical protein